MRRFAFCCLFAAGAIAAAACSAPSKGALILAVSTDMQAPKDVDVVSLYIETNNEVKFDYLGRVQPDGSVNLPSTLAIVEPDDPNAQVRIRVTAFKTQPDGTAIALVLRDILTTVPHERTALLRVPLNFLDKGTVTGTLPSKYVPGMANNVPDGITKYGPTDPDSNDPGYLAPACDYNIQGLTSVAGTCVNANVDSSKVPDYADDEVFGDGGTSAVPACFPVADCFQQKVIQQNITMASDGSCNFAIPAGETGQSWNCALATTDGTGTCIGPNGGPPCLVPLESDPGEGFTVQPGQQVTMVPGVCKKLFPPTGQGAQLYLDKSSCQTKVEAAPVCQPGAAGQGGDASTLTPDGGTLPMTDAATAPEDSGAIADASLCVTVGGKCSTTSQCCSPNALCAGTCIIPGGSDAGAAPQDSGVSTGGDAGAAPSDGAAP